ncbi:MAG: iron-sulfur cluster assembly accessory protein [Deltaproteobacteria bacterium]|nr:iron-sulfur cluster assembly accessory protein [Deltaproteobacteria bacterium]
MSTDAANESTPAAELPTSGPVVLTDAALEQMRTALEAEPDPDLGIRVAVVGGGCAGFQYSMNLEKGSRPGDTVWVQQGISFFVDKLSIGYLAGCQVDWVSSPMGAGFKFTNPNVTTTCGCGSSFA